MPFDQRLKPHYDFNSQDEAIDMIRPRMDTSLTNLMQPPMTLNNVTITTNRLDSVVPTDPNLPKTPSTHILPSSDRASSQRLTKKDDLITAIDDYEEEKFT
jgi:hypothetical protein